MIAHASLGKLFDLPVVLSTSAENGPNGPLPKAILDMYPDAPLIKRQGEVDAWDNPEFRKAIEDTGKKQVIMAGITTDVCKYRHVRVGQLQSNLDLQLTMNSQ